MFTDQKDSKRLSLFQQDQYGDYCHGQLDSVYGPKQAITFDMRDLSEQQKKLYFLQNNTMPFLGTPSKSSNKRKRNRECK